MSDSAGKIKALKVSGHTMSLDPGLYCVFNAPGSPAAGEEGLPGVRITLAPSRQAGVRVAAFNPDGWIGADEGVLVRVADGPAEVLVTVYQANGAEGEPPNLQVVKLSGAGREAEAVPQGAPQDAGPAVGEKAAGRSADAPPGIEVMAHVYARGDVGAGLGEWLGEPGSQRWIEGFGIAPEGGVPLGDIEYQAVLGRGWLSPWSEGGQFCGSRGMSLPILGLRVRLRGASAETHRVVLSATFVDGTKVGPLDSGDACEAPSLAALEAFNVAFVPATGRGTAKAGRGKGAVAAAAGADAAAAKAKAGRKGRAAPAAAPVEEPKAKAAKAGRKAKPAAPPAKPAPAPRGRPATRKR